MSPPPVTSSGNAPDPSTWAQKYRGATVEDLEPPPALSVNPTTPIRSALQAGFERDFTHFTVVDPDTRALLGYLSIPHLKKLLSERAVSETDTVSQAMQRFRRKKGSYTVITMTTPLEQLQAFFEASNAFAVVTDPDRRFVLGVSTAADLEEFVKRRPA